MNDGSRPNRSSPPSEPYPQAAATDEADSPHSPHSPTLLPNLPDDVALQCIARIPRFYHRHLSLVSNSWRSMLRSPLFFATRDRLNCTQYLVYLNFHIDISGSSNLFALDLNPRSLSPVPPSPSEAFGSAFAVLGPRIYVLGGFVYNGPVRKLIPSSDVWIFDCRFSRWEIGPRMTTERKFAVAGVLNGKIYVMAGCCYESTNWAEVFDPALGSWATVPSPFEVRKYWGARSSSAVMEEKFYALNEDRQVVVVFDPCDVSWHEAPTGLRFSFCYWSRGACGIDGILYCCDYLESRIRGFDQKEGKWKELKGLQKDLSKSFYGAEMVNVGGRLCLFWEEHTFNSDKKKIDCAEIEIRKDSDGGLWGSVVWSQMILELEVPFSSILSRSVADCLAVEF